MWFFIRLLLVFSVINQWHTRQVELFIAYPKSLIEHNMYMKFPKLIDTNTGKLKPHML